ncbi:MAG: hypothetical protein Q4F34_07755, partial [Prevotellaceae bacterium]|nr:hypothetical protein [Prevotellaceae bacterium]
ADGNILHPFDPIGVVLKNIMTDSGLLAIIGLSGKLSSENKLVGDKGLCPSIRSRLSFTCTMLMQINLKRLHIAALL